jgi:hypothetical protein
VSYRLSGFGRDDKEFRQTQRFLGSFIALWTSAPRPGLVSYRVNKKCVRLLRGTNNIGWSGSKELEGLEDEVFLIEVAVVTVSDSRKETVSFDVVFSLSAGGDRNKREFREQVGNQVTKLLPCYDDGSPFMIRSPL